MIEPDPSSIEHRNWCQWVPIGQLSAYHTSAWSSIKTRTPRGTYTSRASQWVYARTTGGVYRSEVERLPSHHQVDWVQAHVVGIDYDKGSDKALVTSTSGLIEADVAFSSVHREPVDSSLWQHFHGWEVEADRDVFDPDCATLMDFDVDQVSDGVVFMYVLPYNARRALVECTAFSPAAWDVARYERYVKDYLEKEFSLVDGNYVRTAEETGRIPMRLDARVGAINPKTWPIGSVANTIKPSTGYAFSRIQHACSHIVDSWERTGIPALPERSAGRFAWYDKLMLDIIDREPELMVPVFDRLFKGNSIDNVFTFLDEKSSLAQDARMFMKLPKKPFLKAVWRTATF